MASRILTCVFCGRTMPQMAGEYRVIGIVRGDGPAPVCVYACWDCAAAGLSLTPGLSLAAGAVQLSLPMMEVGR